MTKRKPRRQRANPNSAKGTSFSSRAKSRDAEDGNLVEEVSDVSVMRLRKPAVSNTRAESSQDAILDPPKGLINLGNTCFFNSVMQNLCRTPGLIQALQKAQNLKTLEIDGENLSPLHCKLPSLFKLSQALLNFLVTMNRKPENENLDLSSGKGRRLVKRGKTESPRELFNQICVVCPRFRGYQQQDSQELLRTLLDGIKMEEIKRRKQGILSELGLLQKKAKDLDEELKGRVKRYGQIVTEQPTVVDTLFSGTLVSSVLCDECGRITQVLEEFLDISLPIVDCVPTHHYEAKGKNQKKLKAQEGDEEEDGQRSAEEDPPTPSSSKYSQKKMKKQAKKDHRRGGRNKLPQGELSFDKAEVEDQKKPVISSGTKDDGDAADLITKIGNLDINAENHAETADNSENGQKEVKFGKMEKNQNHSNSNGLRGYDLQLGGHDLNANMDEYEVEARSIVATVIEDAVSVLGGSNELASNHGDFEIHETSHENSQSKERCRELSMIDQKEHDSHEGKGVNLLNPLKNTEFQKNCGDAGQESHAIGRETEKSRKIGELNNNVPGFSVEPQMTGFTSNSSDQIIREASDFAKATPVSKASKIDNTFGDEFDGKSNDNKELHQKVTSAGSVHIDVEKNDKSQTHTVENGTLPAENVSDSLKVDRCMAPSSGQKRLCVRNGLDAEKAVEDEDLRVGSKDDKMRTSSSQNGHLTPSSGENDCISPPGGENGDISGVHDADSAEAVKNDVAGSKKVNSDIFTVSAASENTEPSSGNDEKEESEKEMDSSCLYLQGGTSLFETPVRQPTAKITSFCRKLPTSLSLRYEPKNQECSIQSCLHKFTMAEMLTGTNKFGCEECTKAQSKGQDKPKTVYCDASKQMLIKTPPIILTLHLKRFQQSGRNLRKFSKKVNIPVEFDLSPFCSFDSKEHADSNGQILYRIIGIVEHLGSMSRGHYTSYVNLRSKNQEIVRRICGDSCNGHAMNGLREEESSGSWYHISDTSVSKCTLERALNSNAYLIFYERIF